MRWCSHFRIASDCCQPLTTSSEQPEFRAGQVLTTSHLAAASNRRGRHGTPKRTVNSLSPLELESITSQHATALRLPEYFFLCFYCLIPRSAPKPKICLNPEKCALRRRHLSLLFRRPRGSNIFSFLQWDWRHNLRRGNTADISDHALVRSFPGHRDRRDASPQYDATRISVHRDDVGQLQSPNPGVR